MDIITINPQVEITELSFHDRAAIVVRDILEQVGFDDDKLRMIVSMSSTILMLPGIGAIGQLQKLLKDIEPLLFAVQSNSDPGSYIKRIPQERIEYFLNQVITRLEWIKYGNEGPEKDQHNEETISTEQTERLWQKDGNTNIPEHS